MSAGPVRERTHDLLVERWLTRLPSALQPRDIDDPSRRRRRVEGAILIIIALIIGVAAIYDVTRQVSINYRLTADIETWRELTGQNFKNVSIEQDEKHFTTNDVACANISFAQPGAKTQICFVLVGPIIHGRRVTRTGFFLPPHLSDLPKHRYGCFGVPMKRYACRLARPAGAFTTPPADFYEEPAVLTSTGKAVSSSGKAAVEAWRGAVHRRALREGGF